MRFDDKVSKRNLQVTQNRNAKFYVQKKYEPRLCRDVIGQSEDFFVDEKNNAVVLICSSILFLPRC